MNGAEKERREKGEGREGKSRRGRGEDRSRGTDIEPAVTSEEPAAISGGFCAPFKNANCG